MYKKERAVRSLMRKTRMPVILAMLMFLIPAAVFPITLVRVGYLDIDLVVQAYLQRYLDAEISMREKYVDELYTDYNERYFELSYFERNDIQTKIARQNEVLSLLNYNKYLLSTTGELEEELILEIVERDIMAAIRKTSELEGFSLILDNTGNFIYGSEDVNLTDRVLFRLDEKLLDLQNTEPLAPLELELEVEQ